LRAIGIDPATLLEPAAHNRLSPEVLNSVQQMISSGLLSVFIAMLAFACLQWLATAMMVRGRAQGPLTRAEAIEAIAA
jgi:hypothetical protein